MFQISKNTKKSRNRRPANSRTNAARRNMFGRRLLCEPLEDRCLLSAGSTGVAGIVWNDLNTNGIRDAGEPGIAGATVELWTSIDGNNSDTNGDGVIDCNDFSPDDAAQVVATTDANGNYAIEGMPNNINFYAVFRAPVGYTAYTAQHASGSTSANGSDVDALGITDLFYLAESATATRNAGLIGSGSSSGFALAVGNPGIGNSTAVTTDAMGNAYITGDFQNTVDFDPGPGIRNLTAAPGTHRAFVAKYSPTGALAWAFDFGGSHAGEDYADLCYGQGIAVTPDGTAVYTTGRFLGNADFDPGASTFNLYVASGHSSAFVCKLNFYTTNTPYNLFSGNFVWAKMSTPVDVGSSANAHGIALAPNNHDIYITGTLQGSNEFANAGGSTFSVAAAGAADGFVCKLDTNGSYLWAKNIGGSGSTVLSRAIAVANDNSVVYITGRFDGSVDFNPGEDTYSLTNLTSGGTDIFVAALDSAGGFVWAKQMGGPKSDESAGNQGNAIAVTPTGDVCTTGWFTGTVDFDPNSETENLTTAGASAAYVVKLDADGEFVWAAGMEGTSTAEGYGIAVGGEGVVYATGLFTGTWDFDTSSDSFALSANNTDTYVWQLDQAGGFVSAGQLRGTGVNSISRSRAIAVTTDNDVYTTGSFGGEVDFDPTAGEFILSQNPDGAFLAKFQSVPVPTAALDLGSVYYDESSATFDVIYRSPAAEIVRFTIDDDDILVEAPDGSNYPAILVGVDPDADGSPLVATYRIDAPDGTWGVSDIGSYTAKMQPTQVGNANSTYVAAGVLGTFEVSFNSPPVAVIDPESVTIGASMAAFNVTYSDSDGWVVFSSLDNNDILVEGPNDFSQWATLVSTAPNANSASIVATYQVNAPGGTWGAGSAGAYTATMQANEVGDNAGAYVAPGALGTFDLSDNAPPTVAADPDSFIITQAAATFVLTYSDLSAVAVSSIGSGNILITGPNDFSQLATLVSVTPNADGSPLAATYQLDAPGGAWGPANFGTYTAAMQANQVCDVVGNYMTAGEMGTFTVTGANTAPSAAVNTPSSPQNANITISYTLTDAESNLCNVLVQYSIDAGTTWSTATAGSGGHGTTGLASSPAGTAHTFVWASASDIVNSKCDNVKIRITPTDSMTGTAGVSQAFTVNNATYSIVGTGDFNGDGTADVLLWNTNTGWVGAWIIKNGTYNSCIGVGQADPNAWTLPGIGDFNGDGTSDVLLRNRTTGWVGAWIVKNGTYNSCIGVGQADPNVWNLPGIGDFNGDGSSDVLLQHKTNGWVGAWILKNGTYDSCIGVGQADPNVWNLPGIGDFNGDGTSDVLLQHRTTGWVGAWIVKNGVYHSCVGIGQADPNAWILPGVGDFNGDGTSDVLLQSRTTGWVGAWIVKNGAYQSCIGMGQADPFAWALEGFDDFDGDGTSDVLLRNRATGWVGAWLIKNGVYSSCIGVGQV